MDEVGSLQKGLHGHLEGGADGPAQQGGAVGEVVGEDVVAALHVDDGGEQQVFLSPHRADQNGPGSFPLRQVQGMVQHRIEVFGPYRLYQVLHGPHPEGIQREILRDGEEDEGAASLGPQPAGSLHAGEPRHEHVQQVDVEPAVLGGVLQQLAGAGERDDLGDLPRAVLLILPHQLFHLPARGQIVFANGNGRHVSDRARSPLSSFPSGGKPCRRSCILASIIQAFPGKRQGILCVETAYLRTFWPFLREYTEKGRICSKSAGKNKGKWCKIRPVHRI